MTEISTAKAVSPPNGILPEVGSSGTSIPLSPAVRLLLETHKLDSKLIPSTGPGGRLLKGDVLQFMKSGGTVAAQPSAKVTDIPPSPSSQQQDIQKKATLQKPDIAGTVYIILQNH